MLRSIHVLLNKPKIASFLANASSAFFAIVSFSLLARMLDSEGLSYWIFFISLSGLYAMINQGLIDVFFVKKWNECKAAPQRLELLGSSWQLALILLTATVILLISLYFISGFYQIVFFQSELTLVLIVFLFFSVPYSMGNCKWNANLEFRRILTFKVLEQTLFLIICSVLYFRSDDEFFVGRLSEFVFASYLIIRLIMSTIVILYGESGIKNIKYGTRRQRKEIISFGGYTAGVQAVNSVLYDSDFYIVHGLRGEQMSSVFAVAKKGLPFIGLAINSMVQVSYNKIANAVGGSKDLFHKEYHREWGILLIVFWPLCILAYILAAKIIYLIGGSEYVESVPVFRAMIVCLFLLPMDKMFGVAFNVLNKPRYNFIKMWIMLATNVAGDIIVLFLGGGLVEVAYVTIASTSMGIIYNYVKIRGYIDISVIEALSEGASHIQLLIKRKLLG